MNKESPEDCIRKAEKKLHPGCFAALFSSTYERMDEAFSLYETAAQIYVVNKEFAKAANCYLKCAWIKEHCKDDASYSYNEAMCCYKKINDNENYMKTIDKCIAAYLKGGKFNDSAKCEYEKGKIFEKENKINEAIEAYDKAIDLYQMDKKTMTHSINEVKLSKADLICINDIKNKITEAKALYDEVAEEYLKNESIGKIFAEDFYMKIILCYFVYNDYVSAKAYISRYFGSEKDFEASANGKLLQGIVKCFERDEHFKEEEDGINKVISNYRVSLGKKECDKCIECLLERVREKMYKEMEEDLNEEEDLR